MNVRRAILALLVCGSAAGFTAPAQADTLELTGLIRDFKRGDQSGGHPDFETCNTVSGHGTYGHVVGMVTNQLNSNGKPVYNSTRPSNDSMSGANNFKQWYTDVTGVNVNTPFSITLSNGKATPGGTYSYSTNKFFPIDGLLWGNQNQKDSSGKVRNFSFTYELRTTFSYTPGQNFMFTGDDDVWVYINSKKVMDLGGVHSAVSGNVILFDGKVFSFNASSQLPTGDGVQKVSSTYASQLATKWSQQNMGGTCPLVKDTRYIDLGLVKDQECTLDFFFAERHVTESNFRIDTSMKLKKVEPTTISPTYD